MSQWFERQDAERESWGAEYEDSGRVFTYEDGRALRPEYVTDAFTWQVNKHNAFRRRRDEQGWDLQRIARVHRMSVERVEIALSGPPRAARAVPRPAARGRDDGGGRRGGHEGHQR
ncbi:hypothetical protein [Actinomadura sp. NTSP31]|uniref:hypothetical protein n=1 Tax=Actinomadura sp. NTSP31 TaxID=1735447 RepID=UPI0035C1E08C